MHIHPDSDFSIQKKLDKRFHSTSAFLYDYKTKFQIVKASKQLVKENIGKEAFNQLISLRWGNWALDGGGVKATTKLNFKIDSSATPGIKGHLNDGMKYDWSNIKTHYPWLLDINNHQNINKKNSNILEIPIATFDFFGLTLRADPVNSVLLEKAFDYYYNHADRSERPFVFVVISHSSEATYRNGAPTRVVKSLEEFILHTRKFNDVKFTTLKESYNLTNT